MATARNPYGSYTIVELAKRLDPSGNTIAIAEVLAETNEILQDAPWLPSNDIFAHKTTRRVKLPSGTWRKINAGVATETSKTEEVWERIGMLESYSEIDVELIRNAPNPNEARMMEARAFLEGMGQTLAQTLVYGSTSGSSTAQAAEEFQGLATRMSALDTDGNVLNAGGSGSDVTSVYVVCWGPNAVHMVYPKNDAPYAGIKHEDLGIATVTDATTSAPNTSQFQAYRDHFIVKAGLVVRDPRCIGRVANIETTGSTNLFDEDDLITLLNRMPGRGRNAHIYANETIITQMEIALKDKSNVNYTPGRGEGLAGEPVMYFRGHPVRLVEQITDSETAIS